MIYWIWLNTIDGLGPVMQRKLLNHSLLYYKGEIRKNIMGVGIVGSRRCTSYGRTIAIEAASYLAKNNITVISGMAKGIDGYAHTACLKAGGYTVAFS